MLVLVLLSGNAFLKSVRKKSDVNVVVCFLLHNTVQNTG